MVDVFLQAKRDLRIPEGMLWGAAQLTPELIVEAYYTYDWDKSELPASGTNFSSQDGLAPDGTFIQAEGFGNQFGTDLTLLYGIPAETLKRWALHPSIVLPTIAPWWAMWPGHGLRIALWRSALQIATLVPGGDSCRGKPGQVSLSSHRPG